MQLLLKGPVLEGKLTEIKKHSRYLWYLREAKSNRNLISARMSPQRTKFARKVLRELKVFRSKNLYR